jgi:hypothetical protein
MCGTSLLQDEAAGKVRRIITFVTSDLKGSTALGERLDPEALREVLNRYFGGLETDRSVTVEGAEALLRTLVEVGDDGGAARAWRVLLFVHGPAARRQSERGRPVRHGRPGAQ